MQQIRGEQWLGQGRGRRRRVVRSAALLMATGLAAAGCGWSQNRAGPEGTGYNALESTIAPANVAQLEPAWSRPVGWTVPETDGLSPIARNGGDLVVASATPSTSSSTSPPRNGSSPRSTP